MESSSALSLLVMTWSAVTAVLIGLIIYRAIVGIHEEDQIYLSQPEVALEKEQIEIVRRIGSIDRFVKGTAVLSGVLLFAAAALWVYRGFTAGQMPS